MQEIPGSGRSREKEMATHFICLFIISISQQKGVLCLGDSMDRGTWQATVHGVTKEQDAI